MIRAAALPRSRFFVWDDPNEKHDIVLFIGEAQPQRGKYAFCRSLIEYAKNLGVERVFTFAAMATEMSPEAAARVFGAATDEESLAELKRLELDLLEDGHIGGLNGVLLGAAAEAELRGTCLLGEMPHVFAQLPFSKASQRVLEVFTTMAGIELDFTELSAQAEAMEQKLSELWSHVQSVLEQQRGGGEEEETYSAEPETEALDSAPKTKPASSNSSKRRRPTAARPTNSNASWTGSPSSTNMKTDSSICSISRSVRCATLGRGMELLRSSVGGGVERGTSNFERRS